MQDILTSAEVSQEVSRPPKKEFDITEYALSQLAAVNGEVQRLKGLLRGRESVVIKYNKRPNAKVPTQVTFPEMTFLKKDVSIPQPIAEQLHRRAKGATKALRTHVIEYEREYKRGEEIKALASKISPRVVSGIKLTFYPKQCLVQPVGETKKL